MPTPSEMGLRNALENPDLLSHLSRNFFQSRNKLDAQTARAHWKQLNGGEKEEWMNATVEYLRSFAEARSSQCIDIPNEPDPPGGEPVTAVFTGLRLVA